MRSRRIVGATLLGAYSLLFAAPGRASPSEAVIESEATPAMPPVMITSFALDLTPMMLEDHITDAFPHLNGRTPALIDAVRAHLGGLPVARALAVQDNSLLAIFPGQSKALLVPLSRDHAIQAKPFIIMGPEGLEARLAPLRLDPHNISGLQALTDAFYDLRFAHRLRTEWIDDEDFHAELARRAATHGARLGQIPPALSARLGGQESAFAIIDGLASRLHDAVLSGQTRQQAVQKAAESMPLPLSYLASGETGDVYTLQAGDEVFTLKVYREGSAAEEYRALQFFSDARDMKRGYAAGGGWLLAEYLARGQNSLDDLYARGNVWVHEKLEPHKIVFSMRGDDQRIDGILIDPGSIHRIRANQSPLFIRAGVMNLKRGLEEHLENAR